MAKTIKFNLICDGKPVRTIEDLQNNFSIEDVLEYYNNKLLHRWLKVREYTNKSNEINKISTKDPIEIIKELIKIFDVDINDGRIEKNIYILEFLNNRQTLYREYKKENREVSKIINDYQLGYMNLVNGILDNPNNISKIKANISEIVNNYGWALQLDHRNLFYLLKGKSILAIMCLLMNVQSRKYYLPNELTKTIAMDTLNMGAAIKAEKDEMLTRFLYGLDEVIQDKEDHMFLKNDTIFNLDKKKILMVICNMIIPSKISGFKEVLGKNLVVYSGVTDKYWKDLEANGKKYMIISMGEGDYVRSAGIKNGDLSYNDIKNNFVILDGIDYKSDSISTELLYMEV